jgi:hypothetical protein
MTEPQQPDLPFSIKKINVSSEGKTKLIGKWKIEPPIFPPIDFSDETVEFIKDEFLEELKEQNNEQMNAILIYPDAYKKLMEASDTSFLGKLKYGWRLFALSWSDWKDAMYSEDYVEEFFEHLGNCGTL